MGKFEEKMASLKQETVKHGIAVNEGLLAKVAKGLGPSLHNNDSSKVAASDKNEVETIKKNFLIKKLGLADGPHLTEAIKEVAAKMGKSNRNKQRAIFYTLLVEKFNKEDLYK